MAKRGRWRKRRSVPAFIVRGVRGFPDSRAGILDLSPYHPTMERLLQRRPRYVDGRYVAERKYNPFVRSARGGQLLSALELPWFLTLPPKGFGVLAMTGRKTGKTRRRCVRAIRKGDRAYLVAIGGARSQWLKNIEAKPQVTLRIRGGSFPGTARRLRDDERDEAITAYCGMVNVVDYIECSVHRRGRPTRRKVEELHRAWFEGGIPLVVELDA